MTYSRSLGVLALAALSLAACNRNGEIGTGGGIGGSGGGGDKRICTPFATTTANPGAPVPMAAPADPSATLDDCVHRWGYSLAGGRDTADVVARGVVAACSSTLSTWNQGAINQGAMNQGGMGQDGGEALSTVSGAPLNPMGAHMEFAQQRALFYVVQARAGHCTAPAAASNANGARAG